jgi:MFS family permease
MTLFMAVFSTAMGAGLVAPLLPIYAHELGAGAFHIGLIFGAFSISRTLFVPYFGRLSDRKGKKPLLVWGLFLYFFVSLIYAATRSVPTLILIRLGQGFASAMILPVAQAYVGLITPRHKEGRTMGLFNIALYGGLSLGPFLGGVVKDWFSIQVSFLSMGAVTLVGCLLCLLLPPVQAEPKGKKASESGGFVAYAKVLLDPQVFSLFTLVTSFMTCIGIIWSFLPLLAGTKLALSSSAIGVIVMANVLVACIFQTPMGYLADRINKKGMTATGGILAIAAILYMDRAGSFTGLFLANAVLGLAGGICFPTIMALGVIEGRRIGQMGSMMGLMAMAHSLGMLTGPLLGGAVIDLYSFAAIFYLGAVILAMGLLFFLARHRT